MSAGIIDVSVTLSRWPLRRLPCDETPALVDLLRANGVEQAWAGTFDGMLHKDIASANARLAEECAKFGDGMLLPFGWVWKFPDWEEDCGAARKIYTCAAFAYIRTITVTPSTIRRLRGC